MLPLDMNEHIETLKNLQFLAVGESREALTAAIEKLTDSREPNTNLEWRTVHGSTAFGGNGVLGIRIQTISSHPLDWSETESLWRAAYRAHDALAKAANREIILADPERKARGEESTASLIACFEGPIYVEKIPNGYDPDYFVHEPWLIVTTSVGRFKIGWRKRVINIEWAEVSGAGNGEELFQSEDVTKGDTLIHAWNIEDARRYIQTIIHSIKP